MISVDQALDLLAASVKPVCNTEILPIESALFRVLAAPVSSALDVPPADNSSMDGYAVTAADIVPGKPHAVSQRITAGQPPKPHAAGTASRIFTGAEIPRGADAIIIQENAQIVIGAGGKQETVTFNQSVSEGDNIRRRGQDVTAGAEILPSGTRLRPQEIGLLASCGIDKVSVYSPLKLALISTGDELVDLGNELKSGQIYNSNKYLIRAFCLQAGFEFIDLGTAKDNLADTKSMLAEAAELADVVMTTGGVSVGEEDHVKPAVESIGSLEMWKVAIKPGKPLAFGAINNTTFIGLPGNPSSVFTTFQILALPRLKRMQGLKAEVSDQSILLPALFDHKLVTRREYLRARRTHDGVEMFPNQSSGVLSSACWGDGFVIQKEGCHIEKGQPVPFLPYQNLF